MVVTDINEITKIKNELTQEKPVLFVGSAISMFEPTCLPSGYSSGQKIFAYLFEAYKGKPEFKWLEDEFGQIPFEAIMECFPSKEKLPGIIAQMCRTEANNAFHDFFSEQLLSENLSAIITPNYDLAFDTKLIPHASVKTIKRDSDVDKPGNKKQIYFKIHGCSAAGYEDTLVYTLAQEGTLQEWKQKLLKSLIDKKTLVVVGYSGRDFDICPLIAELDYKKIIWLHYPKENKISAYADFLLNKRTDNHLIISDLRTFIQHFYGQDIECKTGRDTFDPKALFQLTEIELYQWKLKILERLSCFSIGMPVLEECADRLDKQFADEMKCNMHSIDGKYRKAGLIYRNVLNLSDKTPKEKVLILNGACRLWIAYGSYLKAYGYLDKARNTIKGFGIRDDEIVTNFYRTELTFYMRLDQVMGQMHIPFLRSVLARRLRKVFKEAEGILKKSGNWDDRQMVQHVSERLNLPSQNHISLPAILGTANLGIPGMHLIAYRDTIRYGKKMLDKEASIQLQWYVNKARRLGLVVEIWKLRRIQIRRTSHHKQKRLMYWNDWKKNLLKTEYPILIRIYTWTDLWWHFIKIKCTLRK